MYKKGEKVFVLFNVEGAMKLFPVTITNIYTESDSICVEMEDAFGNYYDRELGKVDEPITESEVMERLHIHRSLESAKAQQRQLNEWL